MYKTNLHSICLTFAALTLASTAAFSQPYAYVTNIAGNNVSVVNTANNSVVTSIAVKETGPWRSCRHA